MTKPVGPAFIVLGLKCKTHAFPPRSHVHSLQWSLEPNKVVECPLPLKEKGFEMVIMGKLAAKQAAKCT